MALLVASAAWIARPHAQVLRAGASGGRLAAAPRRQQRRVAALPAAASEAFADAAEAVPDAMAGLPPAVLDAMAGPPPVVLDAMAGPPPAAAADAFAAAQAAAESDPTNLVFTALFTIAVAALSVVTLGVAYLSFTSWNDSRMEAADRARFDSSSFRPSGNGSTAPKKAKAAPAKEPEEFKGFGKK
ncbi:hypothetical protein ABPG75_004450 [Micractinium tetrahymenae]